MSACAVCTAMTDGFLCQRCGAKLKKVLAEMPALIDELEITATKQDKIGAGGKRGKGDEAPLPFNWSASDQLFAIMNTLGTWARHMFEARYPSDAPFPLGEPAVFVTDVLVTVRRNRWFVSRETRMVREESRPGAVEIAQWLLGMVQSIRMDEAGGQIYDEVTYAHDQAQRLIDRPEPEIYAGRCDAADVRVRADDGRLTPHVSPCGADLYARLVDRAVTCKVCGAEYDLAERKKDLLGRIPDLLAPTVAIANALTTLLTPVTPSMIRQMKHRRQIANRGSDDAPMYRVGDVMAVLADREQRRGKMAS